jgi:hypothetical protein
MVRHHSNYPAIADDLEGAPFAIIRRRLLVFLKNVGTFVGIRAFQKGRYQHATQRRHGEEGQAIHEA